MPTIIDGYNLIFTCGLEGRTRAPQSLQKARARVLQTIASRLDDREVTLTTIVFDAKRLPIKETQADSIVRGIRVLYAIDYEDADSLIEKLIAQHSTPKQLTVVSSDHRLQTAATRRKATAIDSDVWWDGLLSISLEEDLHTESRTDADSDKPLLPKEWQATDWASKFKIDDHEPPEQAVAPPESASDGDANGQGKVSDGDFNPFPPGYGEDLLD